MSDTSFETALGSRVDEMLDACTRCGKCVEACPSVAPAGIADASPTDIISGILDILRNGDGPEASRKWASACMLSGECIKVCDYGVNPRFLLAMARVAMAKGQNELAERRRQGLTLFRDDSRDVAMLSQLQLDGEVLERLGQKSAAAAIPAEAPDFVFYTGCNVLKNPHIALLALDIMDALGVIYQVMGGPSHCCGIKQMKAGDVEMSGRMGANSIEKMSHSKSGQVISWCPSCYVQFTETTIPTIERQGGARPFEMTPFLLFLRERLAQADPAVAPGGRDADRAAPASRRGRRHGSCRGNPAGGPWHRTRRSAATGGRLQSNNLRVLPAFERELQRNELHAASDAGIDALVAVYHSDHRGFCAHERDWPFRIINLLEVVGREHGPGASTTTESTN